MFLKEPLFNQMALFYNNNKNKLCILTKQHSAPRGLVGAGQCSPNKKNKAEELYLGFVYVSAALVITKSERERESDAFKCLPAMWQLAQV
jgi:hypothetical protein